MATLNQVIPAFHEGTELDSVASTDSDITWEVILCAGVTASLIGDRVIHSVAYGAVRANNMYKITLIRYIPDTYVTLSIVRTVGD